MPLSISNSEPATARANRITRATWGLILGALALYACAELGARFGLEHVSHLHRKILQESREVNALRKSDSPPKKTLLLLGNSLLEEGVDIQQLQSGLLPRYQMQPFFVAQTRFLDWYYGLERLFRHGARADLVMVCLTPAQLVSDQIRGDFSAHMLFDAQDIWSASRDSGADLTTTSGYYLAHLSAFYATRSELRSVFMYLLASPVQQMWHQAAISTAAVPHDEQLNMQTVRRLQRLSQLCKGYGAEFVFLLPPTLGAANVTTFQAGATANVSVIQPVANNSLSADYYQDDGFHLNQRGARMFTSAIIRDLMK